MRIYIIYIVLTVVPINLNCISLTEARKEIASVTVSSPDLDQLCESYILKIAMPLLNHIQNINDELDENELIEKEFVDLKGKLVKVEQELQECQRNIKANEMVDQKEINKATTKDLRSQNNLYQKNIDDLLTQLKSTKNCDQLQKEVGELKTCEFQLNTLKVNLTEKTEEVKTLNDSFNEQLNKNQKSQLQTLQKLLLCQSEVKTLKKPIENPIPSSCVSFRQSPGVHNIRISELGTINVLCDSQTVGDGDGWIVIQRRINGKEDFYKNWGSYRNGFGSFDGDFFLGLENLHHITMSQQQELFIHMKSFNGRINYARYDNFRVGSEEESYKLISLGEFSSNQIEDMLKWHETQKFSTYDRDNDAWEDGNCAVDCHGGWWYNGCASCNLNGKYSDVETTGFSTVYWAHYVALKEVRMLIRPKPV